MNLREWLGMCEPTAMLPGKDPNKQKTPARIRKKKSFADEEVSPLHIWKLAFADFMTALMAFFLVMWLVNTSPKDKITGLANYFNPIRLDSPAPFTRGVRDAVRSGTGNERFLAAKRKLANQPSEETEEDSVFRDPFPALSRLASQAEAAMAAAAARGPDKLNGDGTSRDPFLIDYLLAPLLKWIAGAWGTDRALNNGPKAQLPLKVDAETAGDGRPANAAAQLEAEAAHGQKLANPKTEPRTAEVQRQLENEKTAAQLEKDLAQLAGSLPQQYRPNVTVTAVTEGILISLTDGTKFNMFKISSSVPSPALVFFLEKMGSIVNKYPGGIIVRGHTDARPYAGDPHGNWRLSGNRATMTYYMLLRGNVGDARFLALEGYAERKLKNEQDPLAAENRRIEILIRFIRDL